MTSGVLPVFSRSSASASDASWISTGGTFEPRVAGLLVALERGVMCLELAP